MRKLAAVAASAAVLTVGLQAPAWAADPATDFEISWLDAKLHLTWKDNGEKNLVLAEYDGQSQPALFADVAAGEPNDIQRFSTLQASDKVRFILRTVAADGSSVDTQSPWFDTRGPAAPALQDANLAANLTTTFKWAQGTVEDKTPGDPLDVPGNGSVKAVVDLPGTATKSYPFAAGATTGTIPAQARPAAIKLVAVNEWSESTDTKTVRLGTLGAGITVPASALYGNRLAIKSTLDLFTSEGREERASGIKVELQARAKTTDAWKTYGRYAGNTTAAFDTGIAALGNRQYRLFVPARKVASGNVIALTPASSTSAKSSKTFVKFVSGGFSPSVVRVGGRTTLSVKISPAVTTKVAVQGWDGSRWIAVGDLPLTKGYYAERGDIETERYTLRLRFVAPTLVVNGLTVNANTSPAYNLTVR